jgi:hypothetical protein
VSHANGHSNGHSVDPWTKLTPENTTVAKGSTRGLGLFIAAIGLLCAIVTFAVGVAGEDKVAAKAALASYHVGFMFVVSCCFGALGFVMILHQTNAGWSALLRRQVEHIMSLFPVALVLLLPTLYLAYAGGKPLWKWMDPAYVAGDSIYEAKAPFLNKEFFLVRTAIYFGVWMILAGSLYRYSRRQDHTGDRWLTAKARTMSSYGLLLFALTGAFASFDWTMSLDYHFFSTMWGVYFFAGAMGACLCLSLLVYLWLLRKGKLSGLVTNEHLHDMGKLVFAFTVFWAYIGFSQYFLIWYANIPEETSYIKVRTVHHWSNLSVALAAGRFVVPFLVLMPRPFRRNRLVLGSMALWIIGFTFVDLFWQIRPQVTGLGHSVVPFTWMDGVAMAGPALLFLGALVVRISSGPLVPVNDPRLGESLHHKNYV